MNVCIIPARGGSKRIPRKNIKEFCGRPMIAYSIEAALNSQCFDRVIVSTDDQEIADISMQFGAEVPFMRPPDLADDYAGTLPVIAHAIEAIGGQVGNVCCLYATAPFIQPEVLRKGFDLLEEADADYALSVVRYGYPIQRALKVTSSGRLEMYSPSMFSMRSQDLEESYHDAGQFYWGRASAWLKEKAIFSDCSLPVELPAYRVKDIDTIDDWIQAELMYKLLQEKE